MQLKQSSTARARDVGQSGAARLVWNHAGAWGEPVDGERGWMDDLLD